MFKNLEKWKSKNQQVPANLSHNQTLPPKTDTTSESFDFLRNSSSHHYYNAYAPYCIPHTALMRFEKYVALNSLFGRGCKISYEKASKTE